jgi:hypothetical protein
MKLFEIPMVVASLFGLGFLTGLDSRLARADFTLDVSGPVTSNVYGGDWVSSFSSDGLEMYIESSRGGGQGGGDIWVLKRSSKEEDWGPAQNLGAIVNTASNEGIPCISADGLTLYFWSSRPGGYGSSDIYATTRISTSEPWGTPVNLGPEVNTSASDYYAYASANNLELYFTSNRPGGYGGGDIYLAKRATVNDAWGDVVNLGPIVNSPGSEAFSTLSPDGLLLLFSEHYSATADMFRPGGYGGPDIWMARRSSLSEPWQTPVNLGPSINSSSMEIAPCFSPDGSTLYFASDRKGWASWEASIHPILDLNGDGEVDHEDVLLLTTHMGEDYPPCDIGPMPWGDGVVDMRDLVVLMKYTGETDTDWTDPALNPRPDASGVLCDVVLSWASPEFVDSHDVYLGTSFDDVNNATRDDPCGVLVSEGHAETAFDHEGLLEFDRTYYWRVDSVDVVIGSLEPMIYRGPVLKFTTEPFARPIQNIAATASSRERGMGPENTVNDSGFDKNDGHSTDGNAMWLSTNAKPHWIQFEFDKVYALHELWAWNSNQLVEPILGFGAKTVKIEYSVDGAIWTTLDGVPEFARAPGEPAYKPNTTVGFGGVSAKYVKLSIEANWGPVAQTGLAEVRFFYIPDRPWATTP